MWSFIAIIYYCELSSQAQQSLLARYNKPWNLMSSLPMIKQPGTPNMKCPEENNVAVRMAGAPHYCCLTETIWYSAGN